MRSAPGTSKQHDDLQRGGYLAFGLHVQQQVVDYVEDHSVLGRVCGDLQVVVDERERVHSSCRDAKRTRGAPVGPEVVPFGYQKPAVEGQGTSTVATLALAGSVSSLRGCPRSQKAGDPARSPLISAGTRGATHGSGRHLWVSPGLCGDALPGCTHPPASSADPPSPG